MANTANGNSVNDKPLEGGASPGKTSVGSSGIGNTTQAVLAIVTILGGFGILMAALLIKTPLLFVSISLAGVLALKGLDKGLQAAGTSLGELLRGQTPAVMGALISCLLFMPVLFTHIVVQPQWISVLTLAGIYVCLALGLNITVGLAGLLDLGYVAFYAIGAYISALVSLHTEQWWVVWAMVPVVMGVTALFGVGLGSPTLRLRGDYLAIVTLGFGEITRIVLNNWNSMTNGPIGLPNIPYPRILGFSFGKPFVVAGYQFSLDTLFYILVVALAFLIAGVARRLDDSRIGRAWRAIKEDELAAGAMGINTRNLKLLAFACGASFAGVSGMVFAHKQTYIGPDNFTFIESANILCMVVLGGMGSIPGVIVGALILTVLPEKFRDFDDYRMLVLGLSLVVMMRLRPEGLLPRLGQTSRA